MSDSMTSQEKQELRKQLDAELLGMFVGIENEPRTHEQLVAWDEKVKDLQRQIEQLDEMPPEK